MKLSLALFVLIVFPLIIMTSCAPNQSPLENFIPTSQPDMKHTGTVLPTSTPIATNTPTIIPTATQILPTTTPTPVKISNQTISVENIARLTQVSRLGFGTTNQIEWSQNGEMIGLFTTIGVYFYQPRTLELIKFLDTGPNRTGSFSSDGEKIATGFRDVISIWDVKTFSKQKTLAINSNIIWAISFSPDGTNIAVGTCTKLEDSGLCSGGELVVLAIETEEVLMQIPFDSLVAGVSYSPDGKFIGATGDKIHKIIDTQTGEMVQVYTEGYYEFVRDVMFSPDGKIFVTLHAGSTIVWNSETGERIYTLKNTFSKEKWTADLSFSPDGKFLASSDAGYFVNPQGSANVTTIWDIQTGNELIKLEDVGPHIAFAPESYSTPFPMLVALGGKTNRLLLINAVSGDISFSRDNAEDRFLSDIDISSSGDLVAYTSNGMVRVWDIYNSKQVLKINLSSRAFCVAFSPDDTLIATGNAKTVRLWNVEDGSQISTFKVDFGRLLNSSTTSDVREISFSPNGDRFVVTSGFSAKVLSLKDGALLADLWNNGDRGVRNVEFSPRGNYIALGGQSFEIWRGNSQFVIKRDFSPNGLSDLAISPSGDLIATSLYFYGDGVFYKYAVYLWSSTSTKEVGILVEGTEILSQLAFSPDGKILAVSTKSGDLEKIKFFDIDKNQEIYSIEANSVQDIQFSRDGFLFIVGEYGGSVSVWAIK